MVAQNYISELGQNSHDIENSGICGHDSEWMRKWMNEWQTTDLLHYCVSDSWGYGLSKFCGHLSDIRFYEEK